MSERKIALVTGGSRGLGKNMAISIAGKGIDVVITYHSNKDEAHRVVEQIKAMGQHAAALRLDTSDVNSFETFATELTSTVKGTFSKNRFDFLVNNAGVGISAAITDTTTDQFDTLMNIHFKGPFFLTQQLLPLMNDGGSVINLSSGLARFTMPGYAAYGSMKGAVEILTRYQAKEFGARQINVNIVAPGAIETDFGGGAVRDNAQLNQLIAGSTALGRVGLPDDIGGVVAFLCTKEAKWINAQRIEVSGGVNL